jgi:hypothetical protein
MTYDLGEAGDYQQVKENKTYPWPCTPLPNRTIEIFTDDVLTRSSPGVFTKHTGLCCMNILIPESDIIEVKDDKRHMIII